MAWKMDDEDFGLRGRWTMENGRWEMEDGRWKTLFPLPSSINH
jgi:hypothetical protein